MSAPNSLPQLSVGSHGRGSGKACIMNAISYLNGDTKITDMPDCVDPVLASVAQVINDKICRHRSGSVLCSDCSHVVWMLGSRIIGSADATSSYTVLDKCRLMVQLALFAARSLGRFTQSSQHMVNDAINGWLEGKVDINKVCNEATLYCLDGPKTRLEPTTYYTYGAAVATDGISNGMQADSDILFVTNHASMATNSAALKHDLDMAVFAHQLVDYFEEITGIRPQKQFDVCDYERVRAEARLG